MTAQKKVNAIKKSYKLIDLEQYNYILPDNRIPKYPPENRSSSKLLVYKNGQISHQNFHQISNYLPGNTLLVFNETKVIPARLILRKKTGAIIEIFLLEPVAPKREISEAMKVQNTCSWKCMIGNLKKWKSQQELKLLDENGPKLKFSARLIDRRNMIVEFIWEPPLTFAECLQVMGRIPLPPYIKREVEEIDKERYQTVYSKTSGAVAAPTAGLHFTKKIIGELNEKKIDTDFLTLHVSAGTFNPIKTNNVYEHNMQNEQIEVSLKNIENLINSHQVFAVGTTSLRALESIYWFGVKLLAGDRNFRITKLFPYETKKTDIPAIDSLQAIKNFMLENKMPKLIGQTEIFIIPGYNFKICRGLVTNFHLPKSTLILLVAAFIGEDWKKIYEQALKNNYRFLSYGDASLLLPNH